MIAFLRRLYWSLGTKTPLQDSSAVSAVSEGVPQSLGNVTTVAESIESPPDDDTCTIVCWDDDE